MTNSNESNDANWTVVHTAQKIDQYCNGVTSVTVLMWCRSVVSTIRVNKTNK